MGTQARAIDTSKVWGKSDIQRLIQDKPSAAIRALVLVYNNQSDSEKASEATLGENGVGFTKFDATILSSIAEQYSFKKYLTVKQEKVVQKRMLKYWKQILDSMQIRGYTVSFK